MNILLIGNGGREHAIAWKLSQDIKVSKIFIAPGNAGTQFEKKCENINIDILNFESLAKFAAENKAITIVGPEAPLVLGIVDFFQEKKLPIFGPSKRAAILEGSKVFTKNFLKTYQIPTATYQEFNDLKKAIDFIQTQKFPIVIKADGIAAGKGVIVVENIDQAEKALTEIMQEKIFGESGNKVIIEEFLEGEEASFIVVVDGDKVQALATSQDHKRIFENDMGENTGGMGAYSPAPIVNNEVFQKTMNQIIYPTIQGMIKEKRKYQGFLYAGLMIDQNKNPFVIEFNCRLGDPETQPLMMRLESSLIDLIQSVLNHTLEKQIIKWSNKFALGVVLASEGYPGKYKTNIEIQNLQNHQNVYDCKTFLAGVKFENNKFKISGGRVLCITSMAENIQEAQNIAYTEVKKLAWDNAQYRKDIANKALKFFK